MKNFCNGKEMISNKEMHYFLRNYGKSKNDSQDIEYLVFFLGACLDNINKYSIEGDFEIIGDAFGLEEKDFYLKCADMIVD